MESSNFPREFTSAPNAERKSDDEDGFVDEEVLLDPFEDFADDEPSLGDTANFDFEPRLPSLPVDTDSDIGIAFDMASLLNAPNHLDSTSEDELDQLETDAGLLLSGLDSTVTLDEQELVMGTQLENFSLPSFELTVGDVDILKFQDFDVDDRFALLTDESSLWHEERLFHDRSLTTVDCSRVAWVAGGPDLVWLPEQGHTQIRCSVEGGKITQLSLCHGTAVYVTDRGFLGRRHAQASQPELLGRAPGSGSMAGAKLGKYRQAGIEHLWLLLDGMLWLSQDLGASWQQQELDVKAVDVCSCGFELRALGWQKGALQVFTWTPDRAESQGVLVNREDALRFARTGAAKLEALLNLVVVWDTELGVFTSSDAGETFSPCRAFQTPTAAVVGLLDERPAVWVACHDSGIDESLIWQITAEVPTGKCIARIEDRTKVSDDSNGEFPRNRVRGLAWDEGLTRLLAVGSFGMSAFRRSA